MRYALRAKSGEPRVKELNAVDDQRFALFAMRIALVVCGLVVSYRQSVVYILSETACCNLLPASSICVVSGRLSVVLSSKLSTLFFLLAAICSLLTSDAPCA